MPDTERRVPAPACAVADVLLLDGDGGWLSPPLALLAGSSVSTAAPAFTVGIEPRRGGGGLGRLFELCDSGDLAGRTLVIAGAASVPGAVWGEILMLAATRAGVAAVVVDGHVRDLAEVPDSAPALWARSARTVGPGRDVRVASVGEPVAIGSVAVNTDDVVLSDAGGLVAVPAARSGSVLATAHRYAEAEAEVVAALRRGEAASAAYERKRLVVDELCGGGL